MKHLLFDGHCCWHWGYTNKKKSFANKEIILMWEVVRQTTLEQNHGMMSNSNINTII